jgi:hypothetical protein
VRTITGDSKYGTKENIAAVEKAGVRAYVSMADFEKKSPYYGASRFVYDAEQDLFRCPQGERRGNPCNCTPTPPTPRGSAGTGRTRGFAKPAP